MTTPLAITLGGLPKGGQHNEWGLAIQQAVGLDRYLPDTSLTIDVFDGAKRSMVAYVAGTSFDIPHQRRQHIVPGPYSLSRRRQGEVDIETMANRIAAALQGAETVATLVILEPALVQDPPGDGPDARAADAIDKVTTATEATTVCASWGGALPEKVHAHLLDASIDAIGYDLIEQPAANLYNINEYGTADRVSFGLLPRDGRFGLGTSGVIEQIEETREALPAAEFDVIYVTPSGPLEVPPSAVRPLLTPLGEACTTLRGESTS